jgi:hypothetical protein
MEEGLNIKLECQPKELGILKEIMDILLTPYQVQLGLKGYTGEML